MMYMSFTYLFMVTTMLSVVIAGKCGYIRGPLAATKDTVVINLDCSQSTPMSHYVPLQLRDNATHVAVQLLHCHTVPVGLFTNVTDSLTSVTIASEDAVQLLEGTFEGLEHVKDLRLLGFSSLLNLSKLVFQPLRNIETLILDRFCRTNIALSYFGSVLQKLSNTPIKRLVLNDVRDSRSSKLLDGRTMRADDFRIPNTSVKELIISDTPMHYEGSIRRAFPHLVCFHGSQDMSPTKKSLPVAFDLLTLSNTLEEFVLCRYEHYRPSSGLVNMTIKQIFPVFLDAVRLYPELLSYFLSRSANSVAKDCAAGFKFLLGANISRITLNRLNIAVNNMKKPVCFEENNKLEYMDFTGAPLPNDFAGIRGLTKLKYLSLENTHINSLPNDLIQYFPSLEILKLGKLDIRNIIKSVDDNFFAFGPTLREIHLNNCQLTDIPATLFSRLTDTQYHNVTNRFPQNLDSDFRNFTNLKLLNFSSNTIKSVSQSSISKLNDLALRKLSGSNYFVIDLTYNRLHCLCNTTHFIKWLQRLSADSNIKFPGFDSYTCLHTNGSIVRVSEVDVSELEQQCGVIESLVNGSDCPCDEEQRRRLQQVWVHLDGFYCRDDTGNLVTIKNQPLPGCFNQYTRASFIAPVVVAGILGITVLVTGGLVIYYRNTRRVQQVRQCLRMNPVHFVRTALQYVWMQNRQEEHAMFRYDLMILIHDDDSININRHFTDALQGNRSFITRDNILPGERELEAMTTRIRECRWIITVLTSNFLSDSLYIYFISNIQFDRPHALIPIVWEEPLDATDTFVEELLRTGDPLYWPGDRAAPEDKRNFWSSLLQRTTPL